MRSSRSRFSSFSRMNSRERASSARIAAILSASARRICSSNSSSFRLSTTLRLRSSSSARSRFSSRSYFRNNDFWSRSSFTFASFLMFLARFANFRVLKLSAKASNAGLIMAIMVVRQFPPSESSKMRVSLLSRYGMWLRPRGSVKALMTFPSAERDWLIFLDSSRRCPVAPDSRTRSLPAKSTKFSLPTLKLCRTNGSSLECSCCRFTPCTCIKRLNSSGVISFPPLSTYSVSDCSAMMMNTAWERLEISFIFVLPVARIRAPRSISP
mmetsp:Transcript_42921/g.86774  ORF Transcript_42921/g.86774 Transcript_42921/m.86774 type:complete len:269 (-) Transcript_42921:160-966(-)